VIPNVYQYVTKRVHPQTKNNIFDQRCCLYICGSSDVTRWRGAATGKAFGLVISRSWVQILLEATLRNNLRQVVYTYVPLSPSSITWYRLMGGDALRLGR